MKQNWPYVHCDFRGRVTWGFCTVCMFEIFHSVCGMKVGVYVGVSRGNPAGLVWVKHVSETVSLCFQGCYDLVTSFMETNMGIIAGVAFGIAFSQVILRSDLAFPLSPALLSFPGLQILWRPPRAWGKADGWGQNSLLISPQVICLLIFLFQLK